MKRFDTKWLWFAGFALAWLALRVFWITCDTGVPAIWEYGFHTTDEGYYLCGGKEMLLWGSFVDLTRQEALNYCYSYGTHWLSYLAHLCFGLSTWSWRIPFVALYFIAWLLMYRRVAAQSGSAFSFAVCLAVSSLPLVVTYERGASNDATIAALVAIAFCLASGKGRWRIFAAALVTSAIATVKPAVAVMAPIVLSALLEERKTRSRWIDAGCFLAATFALASAWKGLSELSVLAVARESGLTVRQALSLVNATYGLPSIADIAHDFLALASFPRDPAVKTMGPSLVLVSIVPAAVFLTNLLRRKWNSHLLVYFMVPLYAYALNVINSMYTHYFLPLLLVLPAVLSDLREDFADFAEERVAWKNYLLLIAFAVAVIAVGVLFLLSASYTVREALPFYSRIYNLPKANPWRMTGPLLAVVTLAGTAVVAVLRGRRAICREAWVWALMFFLVASLAFAALPAAVVAPRLRMDASAFYWAIGLNLAVGAVFLLTLFARPAALARPLVVAALSVGPIVAAYVLLPPWRAAACELLTRHVHYDAFLARELEQLLPKDAVLLGERSDQALMSLPIRAATTFCSSSNPIPFVERLWKENPKTPLYALIDSQCNYNLQHFKKHEKDYRLELIKTFKMPSFTTGALADVYLCRVVSLKTPAKAH